MQGLDVLRLPPIAVAFMLLTIGLVVAFAWQGPFRKGHWKRHYFLAFTQSLFFPVVIAIGALYRVNPDPTKSLLKVNPVADWSIEILFFFFSLVLIFFWVYRMKGIRWFAFCVHELSFSAADTGMYVPKLGNVPSARLFPSREG